MATYSIVSLTDTTLKVVEDSVEIVFKKCYCSTAIDGDYLIFYAHDLETGKLRQQYLILYSDCISPSEASAALLKVAVDLIINSYAGSGGGVSDGDKGDITVSGSGTVWELNASSNSKIMALIAAY